jgi:hypothetical protein
MRASFEPPPMPDACFSPPFPPCPPSGKTLNSLCSHPPFPPYSHLGQAIEFMRNHGVLARTPLDTSYLKPAGRPFLAGSPAGERPYKGAIASALTDAKL